MSSMKEKTFRKLGRRRIWPSIITFLVFVVMCVFAIVIFLQMFALYIMGTKVVQHYEEAQRVSAVMDALMDGGDTVSEAAQETSRYILEDREFYIMDGNGKVVYQVGTSEPDFNIVLEFAVGREFVAVADSKSQFPRKSGLGTVFNMPVEDVFAGVFAPAKEEDGLAEWLDETIISQNYWLETNLKDENYRMYVKCGIQFRREDIAYVFIFGIIALVLLVIPVILLLVGTIRSIVTQRKMSRLLYLDAVTGGRNWLYFQSCAERILTRIHNKKKGFALVSLHFERYQNYCACYGVKAGEELLGAMEGFLRARVGKYELFARYEGADFGMLLCCEGEDESAREESCRKRVRSLLAELTGLKPERKIHFYAGINMIPPHITEGDRWYHVRKNVDIDQLYTYASAARREGDRVKEQSVTFFDTEMLDRQVWERWVEDNMESALHEGEFEIYFQPKYSPASAKLVGGEALVRWNSPEQGFITPARFIPILEATGFITQLDDYMISHVAKQLAEWTIQGRKAIPISVNVSRAHFAQEGLAEHICYLVDSYGPPHELIELEVTESAFFDDKDILIDTVRQLRTYGFHVSMDDFGAGYSSLNSLKDIPIDVLKLDGEFFRGDEDGRGQIVVREAIQLARNLDMRVVAEGIEKKEQVDFLARQGCDMIQGFFFAKPMPIAEFEEKVEKDA